jgi:hypothetical protein
MTNGICVENAGIVLLNNYIAILFERIGIVDNNSFIDETSAINAVHYLQNVVTGLCKTEEILLPLNKVLCGLSIETPVINSIKITESNISLVESLIKAAISHWSSIADSSINGFRENWLVRNGLLVEKEDRWELTVEKRAYDLLINKSPFTFSIIKYPWMNKPLYVKWDY